jgi:alcohol dehydrogenase class IV
MIATCKYNLPACPDRFAMMARAAGINTVGMSDMKAGEAFIDLVAELKADLGITTTFGDLGLKEKDLDSLAKFAAADICSEGNPKDVGFKEMRAVFASCM